MEVLKLEIRRNEEQTCFWTATYWDGGCWHPGGGAAFTFEAALADALNQSPFKRNPIIFRKFEGVS